MVKYGKSKVPMHKLIRAYNSLEPVYDDPSELFTSPFIRSAFARDSAAADITISSEIGKLNIIDTYNSADYDLGKTRDVLNSVLSIDRALGRVLSRPIGPFEAGTTVTEAVLDYCYTNLINEIYVKSVPNVIGYKLTSSVLITVIPAGTRNNARLRALLPEDAAYAAIPEQRNVNLYMMEKEPLSEEDIALLQDVGALYIDCVCSGAAPIRAYFEEEIISILQSAMFISYWDIRPNSSHLHMDMLPDSLTSSYAMLPVVDSLMWSQTLSCMWELCMQNSP